MRVGFLGGSFDPIHIAHLKLARAALRQCQLDVVHLVPAAQSPFKQRQKIASDSQRLQMLRLALRPYKKLKLYNWEIGRPPPSYTIHTLEAYKKNHARDELFFIIGSDNLSGFKKWRNPAKILTLATLVVGKRPRAPKKIPQRILGYPVTCLQGLFPDVSSTAIRAGDFRGVPPSVRSFIKKKKIYD